MRAVSGWNTVLSSPVRFTKMSNGKTNGEVNHHIVPVSDCSLGATNTSYNLLDALLEAAQAHASRHHQHTIER